MGRKLSKSEEAVIKNRQNNICAIEGCNEILSDYNVDFHHIISLSDGGKTCVENMIGVCLKHHREIHSRINAIKADYKRKNNNTQSNKLSIDWSWLW